MLAGTMLFVLLAGAALAALWLHPRLAPEYRTKETAEIVRLGFGVVATVAALVLGLLISSVKSSFDQVTREVQAGAAELVLTDRVLRQYGPAAEPARALLLRYTRRVLAESWPGRGATPVVDDQAAAALLDQAEAAILALPPDPRHPGLVERAASDIRDVVRRRWLLVEESGSAVAPAVLVALAVWLALIFASFGFNAPRNRLVVAVLLACAASVAGAVALVVEMDGSFTGLVVVPSDAIERALAHMQN